MPKNVLKSEKYVNVYNVNIFARYYTIDQSFSFYILSSFIMINLNFGSI